MSVYFCVNKDQTIDLSVSACVKGMSKDMIYKSRRYTVQKNAAVHGIRADNYCSLRLVHVTV